MSSFENLHRNKKLAFLDGFLSGLVVYHIAASLYKDYQEDKLLAYGREKSLNKLK